MKFINGFTNFPQETLNSSPAKLVSCNTQTDLTARDIKKLAKELKRLKNDKKTRATMQSKPLRDTRKQLMNTYESKMRETQKLDENYQNASEDNTDQFNGLMSEKAWMFKSESCNLFDTDHSQLYDHASQTSSIKYKKVGWNHEF